MISYSSSCQTITQIINQALFNVQEGDAAVSEADLQNTHPRRGYALNHPIRKSEAERQAIVRQAMNRQRMNKTWISSEFIMGKKPKYNRSLVSNMDHFSCGPFVQTPNTSHNKP